MGPPLFVAVSDASNVAACVPVAAMSGPIAIPGPIARARIVDVAVAPMLMPVGRARVEGKIVTR